MLIGGGGGEGWIVKKNPKLDGYIYLLMWKNMVKVDVYVIKHCNHTDDINSKKQK